MLKNHCFFIAVCCKIGYVPSSCCAALSEPFFCFTVLRGAAPVTIVTVEMPDDAHKIVGHYKVDHPSCRRLGDAIVAIIREFGNQGDEQ